jgi:hypothetical protein
MLPSEVIVPDSWLLYQNHLDLEAFASSSETSLHKLVMKNAFLEAGLLSELFAVLDAKAQGQQASLLASAAPHLEAPALQQGACPNLRGLAVVAPPAGDPGALVVHAPSPSIGGRAKRQRVAAASSASGRTESELVEDCFFLAGVR